MAAGLPPQLVTKEEIKIFHFKLNSQKKKDIASSR
jgi:hypothetical protein